MMAVGIGILAGFVCVIGAIVTQRIYDSEQAAAKTKREVEERLGRDLSDAHRELTSARANRDAAEERRKQQLNKLARVTEMVVAAIDAGDGIRINLLGFQNTDPDFDRLFDEKYAGFIEKWREKTEIMLNEELKPLRLGNDFKAIDGVYIGSKSAYGLSRLMNCISELRSIQRALPAYIERIVE